MRLKKLTMITVLCIAAIGVNAGADDLALTKNGTLFRVITTEDGLLLTSRSADGPSIESLVPQTTGAEISSVTISVDEDTSVIEEQP